MNYNVVFTDSYTRRATKFLKRHPNLTNTYRKAMELLEANPYHPSLRLHKLKGKHQDLYSISINIVYRVTLDFLVEDRTIIPVHIGTHDEVYRDL